MGADRAGHDDAAGAAGHHFLRRRPAQHPYRGEVLADDALKVGALESADRCAVVDAGVGDEDVEASMAQPARGPGDQRHFLLQTEHRVS
jgi:hypothetical protein